jgi:hypothetical protein
MSGSISNVFKRKLTGMKTFSVEKRGEGEGLVKGEKRRRGDKKYERQREGRDESNITSSQGNETITYSLQKASTLRQESLS